MSQAAGLPSHKSTSVGWFTAAGAMALVATGLVLALNASNGGGPGESPAAAIPASAAPRPSGLITYEVTGKGFFKAKATGEQLGAASAEDLHFVHNAVEQDRVPSPDGSRFAAIERNEAGTWLQVGGSGLMAATWHIAGPSDPALVNGGKGAARAVAGIPLVVAWSPDSNQIAYGSITGEPFTLRLADPRSPSQVRSHEVSGGYIGELSWSPDGRYLAISTYSLDRKNHTVFMLDLQGSGEPKRLVDGCHLTWSPDSKYLAIHRDPGLEEGAWVISPDGEERYAISREPGAFPYAWREA